MSFFDLIAAVDGVCFDVFDAVSVTLHPQDGSPDVTFKGLIENPAMAEDYVPGSSQGVSVIRLYVRFVDISPLPRKGDTLTLNGVTYDLFDKPVDREGGATLKLRRNA